jgi:hypothetical protein
LLETSKVPTAALSDPPRESTDPRDAAPAEEAASANGAIACA